MSERISGGLLCAMAGAAELWLIKLTRSMARLCATIPTGCLSETVGAPESGPRRNSMRNGDRRLCKSKSSESKLSGRPANCLILFSPRRGPGSARIVTFGCVGDPEFVQHRAPVLPIVPDRDEIKLHLWIFIDHFGPPAGFEFSLAVGAPRRPEVNDGGLWRFDRAASFCSAGMVRRRQR